MLEEIGNCDISIGDWVECNCLKGYWLVIDIKQSYFQRKDNGLILILKKGFTPQMKFRNDTNYAHILWCKKVSCEKKEEIERLFLENPKRKKAFDDSNILPPPTVQVWTLAIDENQLEEVQGKLKELPEFFTIGQFNRFVEKNGIRKYMRGPASPKKYILSIETNPWIVDKDKNSLWYNCEIEINDIN